MIKRYFIYLWCIMLCLCMPGFTPLHASWLYDTAVYKDKTTEKLVKKFASESSHYYNKPFAGIVKRIEGAADNFIFIYDEKAPCGSVTYNGMDVIITICDLKVIYGTESGLEGCLFEEAKHIEQFLDGKTRFRLVNKQWLSESNLYIEVEAKLFVAGQFEIVPSFISRIGETPVEIPTMLYYLKNNLATDEERAAFLQKGAQIEVSSVSGYAKTSFTYPATYPTGTLVPITNDLKVRTKTDNLFGYPPVAQ